jgi:Tfp pilus assembly protein PilF
VSRVHDALRRGREPAAPSASKRTAHADAVLTALGYRSARRHLSPSTVIAALVVVAFAGLLVWSLLPGTPPTPPTRRVATVRNNPAPVSASAKPQESKPPPKPVVAAPVVPPDRPIQAPVAPADAAAKPQGGSHEIAAATPPAVKKAPDRRLLSGDRSRQTPAAFSPLDPRRSIVEPPSSTTDRRPSNPIAPDDFQLALYYQRSGDFEQALMHYKAVLQRDEMSLDAHNNIGNLYMGKGLFVDAEREFRRVTAIQPTYVAAHVNLSAALYQQKRYDEAAAEARAAIGIDARNEDAYVNLGLAQAAAGQTGEARSSLTRALEIDKHNAAAHYNLALQYEKAGEIGLALDHYNLFLQFAGPEQAASFADVRARIQALQTRIR